MLVTMKHTLLISLLVVALPFGFNVHAGLYKGLDEAGNVVYSDKPFDEAQKFTPPPLSVIDATNVPAKEEVAEEEEITETKYSKFSILAPTNQQVIWNEADLTVSTKLEPALAITEGHNVWLLMDGKPLVKNSQSLSLQIGRADRGEHQIQAQIRNKKGKILKSTKSITVHIKNTVISRPVRPSPL